MKVNSEGTFNMLDFAKEKQARFLLASTSEVYGDPLVNPQSEEYWGKLAILGKVGYIGESWLYWGKLAILGKVGLKKGSLIRLSISKV